MSGRQCSLTARRTWLQIRPRVFLYRVCWDWLQQTQLGKRMCWCESSRKENNSPSLVIHFSFLVKKLSHTVTSCHMYQSHPTCTKCICHTLHVPVNKWSPGTFVPQKRCDWLFRPHLLTSLNLCSDSLYGISRQIKTTSVISLSAQSALQHFHVQIQTLIAGVTPVTVTFLVDIENIFSPDGPTLFFFFTPFLDACLLYYASPPCIAGTFTPLWAFSPVHQSFPSLAVSHLCNHCRSITNRTLNAPGCSCCLICCATSSARRSICTTAPSVRSHRSTVP